MKLIVRTIVLLLLMENILVIKILTGWGNIGGSTVAHINLCNAFNERGIECKLYSPHFYHFDKCPSGSLQDVQITPEDNIIAHFLNLPPNIKARKIILSVHEQNVFDLSKVDFSNIDMIHFVADHQKDYHKAEQYNKPFFILSNIMDKLSPNPKKRNKAVGIIGSVDENKQVHVSIMRAIGKGFKDITLYGKVTDQKYYEEKVLPLIRKYHVKGPKFAENKQEMYDSITDVFFSSKNECLSYVIGECKLTNTKIHLLENKNYANGYYETDNEKIINKWKEVLDI